MVAWWRMSRRHPQSSRTRFEGGDGFQMPDDPARQQRKIEKAGTLLAFFKALWKICADCHISKILTVLILTLMTGMRERQEDEGSGLSAFMFTLENQRTLL